MKYIKKYEVYKVYNMSYLINYKKYILLVYGSECFIVENLGEQLKKIYSNEYGSFQPYNKPFYFTLPIETFKNVYAYDSDNLEKLIKNLDLYKSTRQYNL